MDALPPGEADPDWYFDHVIDQRRDASGRVLRGPIAAWDLWWRDQERVVAETWPALSDLAGRQGFAFTTAQLAMLGTTRKVARGRVARGTWWAPQRGTITIVPVGAGDRFTVSRRRHALAAGAAALLNPEHGVGGPSAAIMHGLPTMRVPGEVVLIAPAPRISRRARSRIAGLDPLECDRWHGVLVTSIARTVVDQARSSRREGLMAADAALHEQVLRTSQLDEALARAAGWPGIRQAREVLALACAEAESALESLTRLALHDSGFPPPRLQIDVPIPGRRHPYRVDFMWPEQRLILEADGRVKYDRPDERSDPNWEEKKRETALRRAHFEVERVLWDDVVNQWPATEVRLKRYFR